MLETSTSNSITLESYLPPNVEPTSITPSPPSDTTPLLLLLTGTLKTLGVPLGEKKDISELLSPTEMEFVESTWTTPIP